MVQLPNAQGATELCPPPHDMPQSTKASTDVQVALCPKMWTATPLAVEKTVPEQRCGGCGHTERCKSGSEVLLPGSSVVNEEVPLQPVWKR